MRNRKWHRVIISVLITVGMLTGCGSAPPDTVASQRRVDSLLGQGRYAEAEPLVRRALDRYRLVAKLNKALDEVRAQEAR